jgi:hypothetical protein
VFIDNQWKHQWKQRSASQFFSFILFLVPPLPRCAGGAWFTLAGCSRMMSESEVARVLCTYGIPTF